MEAVTKDLKPGKKKDLEQAASCFVKLALADPEWALDLASGRGPESHRLTMVLSSGRLASILPKLKIKNVRLGALLRAQLLSSSASWGRKRSDGPTLLRKAWKELQRIPESERDDQWKRLARTPHLRWTTRLTLRSRSKRRGSSRPISIVLTSCPG